MKITINRNILKNMARFASTDASRIAINGVYLEPNVGGQIRLTATDGHILGQCVYAPAVTEDCQPVLPEMPFILPADAIKRVCKVKPLKCMPDVITVTKDSLIASDNTVIPYVPVDAEFPRTENVIPKANGLVPTVLCANAPLIALVADIFSEVIADTRRGISCPLITYGDAEEVSPVVVTTSVPFAPEVLRFFALIMPMRIDGRPQRTGARAVMLKHLGETEPEETEQAA